MNIHKDFNDIIAAFKNNNVEFIIAGSFALAYFGHPRATGDIDIWIRPSTDNGEKVLLALNDFGFSSIDLTIDDIVSDDVIQLGYPPVRIDLLSVLDGVSSDEIWSNKTKGTFGDHTVYFIGKETFIKNKRFLGRHKDLADIEALE